MKEEIDTVSEEQVLHNELRFEINQELIHLMKRIVELQQENQQLKDRINKAIEYIEDEAYLDYEREISHDLYDSQIFKLIEILKEDNKEEK